MIDLGLGGWRARGYEVSHTLGLEYPASALPDDAKLRDDLSWMLDKYDELLKCRGPQAVQDVFEEVAGDGQSEPTFQRDVERAKATHTEEAPQPPAEGGRTTHASWKRDPGKAKEAIELAGYKCEADPRHETFTSNQTGMRFVEAHHLIPMRLQGHFRFSLDVPGNIVALCPRCHRMLHHAMPEERDVLLRRLHAERGERLKAFGIDITEDRLIQAYGWPY